MARAINHITLQSESSTNAGISLSVGVFEKQDKTITEILW